MSAEKSTDWLIDLLYQDEVEYEEPLEEDLSSQDSSEELERPLELLSAQQEAELSEHRQWLGTVRQSLILAQPSEATHDAIMKAAREQLITHAEREAQAVRKPQPVRHSPEGTLWARARFGTMAQIASLATVLVVGIFFLGRFQDKMPTMSESAPAAATVALNDAEQAAPAAAPEPTAAQLPAEPVATGSEAPAQEGLAQAPEDSLDFPTRDPAKVAQQVDEKPNDSLAINRPLEEKRDYRRSPSPQIEADAQRVRGAGGAQALEDTLAKNAERSARSSGPEKKSAPLKELDAFKSKDKADNDDGFAFSGKTEEQAQKPTKLEINDTAPARTLTRESAAEPAQDLDSAPMPSSADQPTNKFLSPEAPMAKSASAGDSGERQDRAIANMQPRPQSSAPKTSKRAALAKPSMAPASAPRDEEVAEAEAVMDNKAQTKPATPSLSITEQAFRADRFKDAASEADRFLKTGRGTPDERARALEIKAQAYERLGRGDDAYRVYEQLEREYPGYFKKKAIDRPKKRSKKKDAAKSNIDMMESY